MATAQESRLSIVIDSAKAEERIKALREQLRELGNQSDDTADNTDDLARRQRRASDDTRRLTSDTKGLKDANEKFGKSIAGLRNVALVGFGALSAVMGGSIKTAIDFEKAMAGVDKTVDFAAENGLANMTKGIKELTKEIPLAFEELAEIASVGGQLGVVEDDILGFTETIAKMGVAFDISAGEAADSMAKIANGFKIPIANIGELGDTINAVSNSMAANAGDVINFMGRVSGSSAALGIAADDVAALGGAFAALNLQPEIAGTAFNIMVKELAAVNGEVQKTLDPFAALGLDTKEFADTIRTDGVGAIKMVLEAAKEIGGLDAYAALNDAFGAQGAKIATMAEGYDTITFALDQVGMSADGVSKTLGSMEAEFQSVSSTTANKMELVKNNMRLLAAGVGEAFLPAVNDLLASLIPVIEKMTAWAQANPELITQIAKVTAVVLGAVIAMAAISGVIGTVITTFQGLSAIFTGAKLAIMALSGPIGLTVIALGILVAAGALVYQNWDMIKAKATEVWGSITSYIGDKVADIKGYFTSNFPAMSAIVAGTMQTIGALFVGGFNLLKNTVVTVMALVKAVFTGDFKAIPKIIGDGLSNAAKIVNTMLGNILNIFINTGKKLFNIGKDFINGFINGIKSAAGGAISAASSMVGNAIEAVRKRQNSNSDSKVTAKLGKDFAGGMATGIKKGTKKVVTAAEKMAADAVKAVQDGVANLKREIALFGNDSAVAALDYDIKVGKFGGANTGELRSLTQDKEQLELSKKLADANKSVQDSIDGLIKQQALFGNNSSLASLMYDIEKTNKYKDVTKEVTDELIRQTRALEQLGMTAKATQAIKDRFSQLGKDKEKTSTDLQGMLSGIEQESPMGKIQADYEARLETIEKYEQLHTDMIGVQTEARLAVEQSYQDAKRDLMLTQGEALFGDLSDVAKAFAGEQSSIYKGLFAVEKGFAIAQSAIAIQQSVAKAMALGFPQNIPVIAQTVGMGASLLSTIRGISSDGFKAGGYTGSMGVNQVAGEVHGQEYVFDAQSTKRIGVDNLNAMRRGDSKTDKNETKIVINNNAQAEVKATRNPNGDVTIEIVDKMIEKSFRRIGRANSIESKSIRNNTTARVNRS